MREAEMWGRAFRLMQGPAASDYGPIPLHPPGLVAHTRACALPVHRLLNARAVQKASLWCARWPAVGPGGRSCRRRSAPRAAALGPCRRRPLSSAAEAAAHCTAFGTAALLLACV